MAFSICAKLRVENLHYDLTEDDLEDLFTRIGPVLSVSIRFDRAGRSSGTAFVTYESIADARLSIREFDGANAHGQPIRLTLLPSAVDGARGRGEVRNPFDYAVKPGRSLFERVEEPRSGSGRDKRSRSPTGQRRSDTRKPPPEGVDRYVPGGRRSRSRSPPRRGQRGARDRGADSGRRAANGRARKTQDDLDKEMDDYFGTKGDSTGVAQANGAVTAVSAAVPGDGDVEMIE
ncbi:hypothetical protein MMC20_007225 [Loxospora ochrophaea]|nr:hypothetical protein [Loxospora ochrophaea]